ncbi:MAG: dephospho-CoA kinase [Clostridia bacterium]|nr:dephospho-CoA kinase [Clostridia bacterium]MBQ3058576.1 dephospho-CoA kinase [Clostridia bacterium]
MSIIVGLTGPTGAGKSSAATLCKSLGIKHIDCDIIARKATEKGEEGLLAVVKAFGDDILNNDGTLNRKALAEKAFKDKDSTALLNQTLLPIIKKMVMAEIKDDNVLLDAPTLFESGVNEICSKTVAVLSDKDLRLKRILARDNITTEQALLRINAGKSDDFYKEKCDFVIYNNSDENTFNNDFLNLLKEIFEL